MGPANPYLQNANIQTALFPIDNFIEEQVWEYEEVWMGEQMDKQVDRLTQR